MAMMRIFVLLGCVALGRIHAATTPEGMAFLEENAGAEGVTTTDSGLQYKVLESGDDDAKSPRVFDPCKVHYRGTLIDGTEFDSSYSRGAPSTFAPNQVIKGWTEALQMMKEGDKWEVYIKSELAYGDRQTGRHIKPGAVLVFQMELIEVLAAGQDL